MLSADTTRGHGSSIHAFSKSSDTKNLDHRTSNVEHGDPDSDVHIRGSLPILKRYPNSSNFNRKREEITERIIHANCESPESPQSVSQHSGHGIETSSRRVDSPSGVQKSYNILEKPPFDRKDDSHFSQRLHCEKQQHTDQAEPDQLESIVSILVSTSSKVLCLTRPPGPPV